MFLDELVKKIFGKKPKKKQQVHSSFTNFLRDYFTFNKKQRNGILMLLSLIALFSAATFSYRLNTSYQFPDISDFEKELNEFLASAVTQEYENDSLKNLLAEDVFRPSKPPAQLFIFNPNTASERDFIQLGFSKKQTAAILNYRNKGGKFRKKEDFAKMYSVNKEMYERLENFISIPEEKTEKELAEKSEKKIYEKKTEEKFTVELNSADSLELLKIKGIGAYTTMKIIELRTKLGGFHSKEQLREVYKIDSARYAEIAPFFTLEPSLVKKININTATLDELKQHPYINYNVANSLVNIRKQHGNFKSVEDIKKSHLVTEDVFRKIAPYLTVENSP